MLKKYVSILILIIINFCSPNKSYSQNNIDSLKSVWKNPKALSSDRFQAIMAYYRKNTHAKPDSTLVIADYHIELAKQKNAKREIANALNEKSYAYYIKGNTKQSMVELSKTADIYNELGDTNALATIYGNMGNVYADERKFQEAVRYFTKTLNIFQDNGIKKGEARMLNNLGIIYNDLDNSKLALNYFNKAINIYESQNLKNSTGPTITNIGNVYFKQKHYNKAIKNGEIALALLLKENNKFDAADCYFLLAKSYEKLNNTKKANFYINKSIEIDNEIKNKSKVLERLIFEANLTLKTNTNLAIKKAEKLLTLTEKNTENTLKSELYNLLYRCYKTNNDFDKSLKMHEKYITYNDSVKIEKNKLSIIEDAILRQYNEELYKAELKNQKEQNQLELSHTKKIYTIIFISAILIFCILFFVRIYISKNRKHKNKLLKELERLKNIESSNIVANSNKFELNREKIEKAINQKLNKTDWLVLNILLDDPVIPNKQIAEKAFMSVDGIGSSLRRMYINFNIKESKYKKISLLLDAIKISNN